jgi:SpoVK/Ycf46/Vps4 family AAA+-type ATPase
MDEIEKGLSTSESDEGTSKRILGTLLTWMAEKQEKVFLVATSNDIESLPPELVRKGRLDEIFFVDLPTSDIREEILSIHLTKREQNLADFDLEALVAASEGFSGAEIEQAIVSGLYAAIAGNQPLDNTMLLEEINNTYPLSVTMAEKLQSLRQWAEGRAVKVD